MFKIFAMSGLYFLAFLVSLIASTHLSLPLPPSLPTPSPHPHTSA